MCVLSLPNLSFASQHTTDLPSFIRSPASSSSSAWHFHSGIQAYRIRLEKARKKKVLGFLMRAHSAAACVCTCCFYQLNRRFLLVSHARSWHAHRLRATTRRRRGGRHGRWGSDDQKGIPSLDNKTRSRPSILSHVMPGRLVGNLISYHYSKGSSRLQPFSTVRLGPAHVVPPYGLALIARIYDSLLSHLRASRRAGLPLPHLQCKKAEEEGAETFIRTAVCSGRGRGTSSSCCARRLNEFELELYCSPAIIKLGRAGGKKTRSPS